MTNKPAIVIGGGISGITTAIEIAEVGHEVVLVEKLPWLGGKVVRFHEYFPKLCPPYCGLEINFKRIRNNPRIRTITSAAVKKIEGEPGNYKIVLEKAPEFINSNCTACGECENVCPVDRDDEFNFRLSKTKAAYLPHDLAFPFQYQIDHTVCKRKDCGKCLSVCKYDAIRLDAQPAIIELEAASIVEASGWEPYDASLIPDLNFGNNPDIISNVMFERYTAPNGPTKGKMIRPSNGEVPKSVVFVQCAGSRDENHLPYCSAVCCSASLKHALKVRKRNPEAAVKIFYIDLRVSGRNEDFLNLVKEDPGIELIKGKAGRIISEGDKIIVEAEDILKGKKTKTEADLVVLATGIVPAKGETGKGIIYTACSKKPMDVSASLKDACGAALKAIQMIKG